MTKTKAMGLECQVIEKAHFPDTRVAHQQLSLFGGNTSDTCHDEMG